MRKPLFAVACVAAYFALPLRGASIVDRQNTGAINRRLSSGNPLASPEPGTLGLIGAGLVVLALGRRRRR